MVLIQELPEMDSPEEEIIDNVSDSSVDNEGMDSNVSDSEGVNEDPAPNVSDKDKTLQNEGWADAMSKILKMKKPRKRKTLVLSRAKRDNKTIKKPKEEKIGFEIDGESQDIKPDIKEEQITSKTDGSNVKKLKKKDWVSKGHKKPSILDRDRERALAKIATKGVVQLFNAVNNHQKTLDTELKKAGSLEYKKDKVMKSINKKSFLDVLMGNAKSCSLNDMMPDKPKEEDSEQTWDILRDNFMMSAKLKDWDKDVEVKEEV